MDDRLKFHTPSINWRWLVVTYCFLILFHMFPSFLVSGMNLLRLQPILVPIYPWLGIGIIAVCTYVGYRSVGTTIVETGIASVLYVITLFFVFPNEWSHGFYYRIIATVWLAPFLVLIFLAGLGGAAFGKWLQLRKQQKQPASEAI